LIKECLGGSDFIDSNNIELYDWDRGSQEFPHLIKLVRATSTYTDGGYYAVLYADIACTSCSETTPQYRLMTPFQSPDSLETDEWEIYTTKGVLALTSEYASATVDFGSKYFYSSYIPYDKDSTHSTTVETFDWDGDLSCENYNTKVNTYAWMDYCLNKTDIFTIVNWVKPYFNPPQINLYTAERLYAKSFSYTRLKVSTGTTGKYTTGNIAGSDTTFEEGELHYMTHVITADIGSNWGVGSPGATTASSNGQFWVYKFFPDDDSTYEYVAECSNRGLCNTDSGLCECFAGYTNDNCDTQSSIAL
jgi:hypothetical protein